MSSNSEGESDRSSDIQVEEDGENKSKEVERQKKLSELYNTLSNRKKKAAGKGTGWESFDVACVVYANDCQASVKCNILHRC